MRTYRSPEEEFERSVLSRALKFVNLRGVTKKSAAETFRSIGVLPPGTPFRIDTRSSPPRALPVRREVSLEYERADRLRAWLWLQLERYVQGRCPKIAPPVEQVRRRIRLRLDHPTVVISNCWAPMKFEQGKLDMSTAHIVIPTVSELVAFAIALLSDKSRPWKKRLRQCGAPSERNSKKSCGRFFLTIGEAHRPRVRCSKECDQRFEQERLKQYS